MDNQITPSLDSQTALVIRNLLGPKYISEPTIIPPRPSYYADKSLYSRKALIRRLVYADTILRHPITALPPRLENKFRIYRTDLILLLDKQQWANFKVSKRGRGYNKDILLRRVQEFDRQGEEEQSYNPPRTEELRDIQNGVLTYQRYVLSQRYDAACDDSWGLLDVETQDQLEELAFMLRRYHETLDNADTETADQWRVIRKIETACQRIGINGGIFLSELAEFKAVRPKSKSPKRHRRSGSRIYTPQDFASVIAEPSSPNPTPDMHTLQRNYTEAVNIVEYGEHEKLATFRVEIKRRIDDKIEQRRAKDEAKWQREDQVQNSSYDEQEQSKSLETTFNIEIPPRPDTPALVAKVDFAEIRYMPISSARIIFPERHRVLRYECDADFAHRYQRYDAALYYNQPINFKGTGGVWTT